MLYAIYECEHCKIRIAIETTENKIREIKHFKSINESLAARIKRCEYCKLPKFLTILVIGIAYKKMELYVHQQNQQG